MATGAPNEKALPDGTRCPTIERTYGIHYKIPYVGQNWRDVWFSGSMTSFYYEEGTSTTVTWTDYSHACEKLASARNFRYWSDFTATYDVLLNGSFSSVYESDTWKNAYNNFLNDTSFLWGSPEEGGVFIVKAADNPSSMGSLAYWICMWWGLYTKRQWNSSLGDFDDFYKIDINNIGSNRHSLNQFKKVAWFVYNNTYYRDGEDVQNNYSYYSAFLAGAPNRWYDTSLVTAVDWDLNCEEVTDNCNYVGYDITISDIPVFEIQRPVKAWGWASGSDNSHIDIYDWRPDDTWTQIEGVPADGYNLDPSSGGGYAGQGGGEGSPDTDGDDISDEDLGDLNSLTAINSGLVTLYRPTTAELTSFANFLYSGITDSAATQLKKLIANPLEYVIFVALCKFTPPISGEREEIAFCGIGSGVWSDKISNQFYDLDCGTVYFKEQFASFLDYSPNSKVKLYLPFVGCYELSVDDLVGSAVHIKYRIDLLSGCCVAKVKVSRQARSTAPKDCRINSIIYEYTGNVYLNMPLSATDWRGAYQSLVGLVGGVAGGLAGGVGGALAIGNSVASSVLSQKVSVNRSGQIGSAYGYLGQDKPYFILERPIQSVPNQWSSYAGYTSNILYRVGNLSGYTESDPKTVWSMNLHCTDGEANEIKSLFETGVYL